MCGEVWGGICKSGKGGSAPFFAHPERLHGPSRRTTPTHLDPSQVIKMVVKCGEAPGEALQLAVIRALLTFSTAEHFLAHGDCLMAAVRTVFNLALGSEAEIIKRTACNALLQV